MQQVVQYPFDWNGAQGRIVAHVGGGVNVQGILSVPRDARIGAQGSIAYYDYGSSPFRAAVYFSKNPDKFSGQSYPYRIMEGDVHYQVGGTAPPGTNVVVVQPGETWYLNITCQHDPDGKDSPSHQMAFEPRRAL